MPMLALSDGRKKVSISIPYNIDELATHLCLYFNWYKICYSKGLFDVSSPAVDRPVKIGSCLLTVDAKVQS
jgi:hypothetical protein